MAIKPIIKHVVVLIAVIFTLFPVLWMFSTSFKPATEVFTQTLSIMPENPTLDNIRSVLQEATFMSWLRNTIIIAVGIVACRMITSVLAAYGFTFFEFRGKNLLFMTTVGTLMIPFAITMIPNYVTISSLGLLNTHLAVILPYMASGFGVFFLRQYMKSLPVALVEAATIDGANSWQILQKIVFPLVKGPLAALTVWHAIEAWNLFFWPMLVLTEQKMQTLPIAMLHFQDPEAGMLWGELMAMASLISLPTLIVYMFAHKKIKETSVTTGLKG